MKPSIALSSVAAACLAIFVSRASADTIILQDGRAFSGSISRQGDNALIKSADGSITAVPFSSVARITLNDHAAPAVDSAQSDYTRLVAQVKSAVTLPEIIAFHQKFLDRHPDSPLAKDARESLAGYQQLADANAVKFHGQWVSPDQIDTLQKQWKQAAQPALILYNAGQFTQALDAAKAILAKDDQNTDALTLAGLAAGKAKNYGVARKYFTDLAQSDPANGLAQNNLAVVSHLQKQINESLAHYIKALQLIADNRFLLDNITEAINSYKQSGADQNAANFHTLSAAYAMAEAALEARMAQQGLHRFGSTWATKDQIADVSKNIQTIRGQMAQLDAQYKANQEAIAALDARIAQATQDENSAGVSVAVASVQAQTTARAINNNNNNASNLVTANYQYQYQADLAQQNYNNAQQRIDTFNRQKTGLVSKQKDFLTQAQTLKTQLANAENPFTGEQHLMELTASDNPPATAP